MPKNRDEDFEGREEEIDDDFEGGDDEGSDEEGGSDDGPVDFDSDEVLDDPDFDEDGDEDVVSARPAKRRPVVKKVPTIEGVPKTRLDKPDVAGEVWTKLKAKHGESAAVPYKLSLSLKVNDIIDHKTFGLGFVVEVPSPTKADVIFSDGLRKLVHGR